MALKGTRPGSRAFPAGLLLATMLARTPAAADLKIVSEITVTRSSAPAPGAESDGARSSSPPSGAEIISPGSSPSAPAAAKEPAPQTVTTYYKGEQARVEAADGTVTLYDRAAEQVFTLHATDKTYSVVPLKSMLEQSADRSGAPPASGRRPLESKVDLKKDAAAEKKTYAGEEALHYTLTGSATRKRASSGGFSRGGFPRGRRFPGGGFPGGGFPGGGGGFPGGGGGGRRGGGPGSSGRGMPSYQIEGEYWIAPAPTLAIKAKNPFLPSLVPAVPAGPFLSPLNDRLAKIKGFPVASKVTMTTSSRQSRASTSLTTTMTVKSVADAPLAASLFKVPDGYQKVDPPPAPSAEAEGDRRPSGF